MLETSLETICFIVVKARALDAAEGVVEPDPASNPSDDGQVEALAAHGDDATEPELRSFIDNLNDDEKAELVALMRLGRGEGDPENWAQAVEAARADASTPTADYLLGTPLLADLLEEGLNRFGLTCEEVERAHL